MCGATNGVLLERTIGGVAGEDGVWADLMVMCELPLNRVQPCGTHRLVALLTEAAGQAGTLQPFQPDFIPNLNVLDKIALCNDNTSTFMTTN